MIDKEKIRNIIELFIAWNGETEAIDVANLDSAVEFIEESLQEEPVSEEFEKALAEEWQGYVDRGAATVDALEDNTQELAFAKGFYRGWNYPKSSVWHDAKEEPQTDRQILLVMKDGNKKIFTHYGCSEYCIDCVWVKLSEQNKWAYIDDLLKL